MAVDTASEIVIVGAGCFGLSTAYHLLKRGFTKVTVLDRSEVLPAPEAASTDLNKIVRSSYADVFYARLAQDAIAEWKNESEWADAYHESGVFVRLTGGGAYADGAYISDKAIGARVESLPDAAAIRSVFPPGVPLAPFADSSGYLNRDGGWANASQGVAILISKVAALGGRVIPGKPVAKLLKTNGTTTGVACADGTAYPADLVVLSAGSWTASSFPALKLGDKCLSTGQCILAVQLSQEEADLYRACPVYLDLTSGFYAFPPNADNMIKFAAHMGGYTHMVAAPDADAAAPISTPTFVPAPSGTGSRIPRSDIAAARAALAQVYPALAEKPLCMTRMCWYTDSPDEDWVIGRHPDDRGVMLATSGSGHAYKFLPVIGRLVADAIQGTMEPALVQKFALDRPTSPALVSRPGFPAQELDFSALCEPADLLQP
ncbi:FAD dependent oxidoreductase [Amylocystis lapponica]|nr:FAD dependent oxidoreductase [Amylocystis lapponica]